MNLKDLNMADLPIWVDALMEDLERRRFQELKENRFYKEVLEEREELLEEHRFLETLTDRDKITEPMELSVEEAQALSRFLALESDKRDMESMGTYLLGCRYAVEALRMLKII